MSNKQTGFTLLEIISTMVIIGILASVALPKISATSAQQKFLKDSIVQMLRSARSLAVTQQQYIQVYLNNNTTPNRFEFYSCTSLQSIPSCLSPSCLDPSSDCATIGCTGDCFAVSNFIVENGTTGNFLTVSSVSAENSFFTSANSVATSSTFDNPIHFDMKGRAYGAALDASPGTAALAFSVNNAGGVYITPSTGRIYVQ